MGSQSKRTREKRQEQRKDYPEFFQRHCENARDRECAECGDRLHGDVTEIAHIIGKSTNPELATEDENIIYLCGFYSDNRCHSRFDQSCRARKTMEVYEHARQKVKQLEELIEKRSADVICMFT